MIRKSLPHLVHRKRGGVEAGWKPFWSSWWWTKIANFCIWTKLSLAKYFERERGGGLYAKMAKANLAGNYFLNIPLTSLFPAWVRVARALGRVWKSSGFPREPDRRRVELCWHGGGRMWEIFGRMWEIFEGMWEIFGKKWEIFGKAWEIFGRMWEIFVRMWEVFGRMWEIFGRSWNFFKGMWELFGKMWEII